MTEIDDIVPSGSYLSAKTNQVGETFLIVGFGSEKSRFKEGQINLVLTLEDEEQETKKVTLNKQSRLNLSNAFGKTLEKWIGKTITIAMVRFTAVGNTLDFLPAPTPTPTTPTPEPTQQETASQRIQKALDILRGYGEKGAPIKGFITAIADALKINPEIAEMVITAMKNEGWVVEEKGKIKEV